METVVTEMKENPNRTQFRTKIRKSSYVNLSGSVMPKKKNYQRKWNKKKKKKKRLRKGEEDEISRGRWRSMGKILLPVAVGWNPKLCMTVGD